MKCGSVDWHVSKLTVHEWAVGDLFRLSHCAVEWWVDVDKVLLCRPIVVDLKGTIGHCIDTDILKIIGPLTKTRHAHRLAYQHPSFVFFLFGYITKIQGIQDLSGL